MFKHKPASPKMTNIPYIGQISFMSIFAELFSMYFFTL